MLVPILRALLRVNVTGPRVQREPGKGLIIAPNHQSWIDPFVVQMGVLPHQITFLMTELFFDLPLLNLYFRAVAARPVREAGPSVSALRAARGALEQGEVICLFPEGGITPTGKIGDGQRGVARLARRTGAAVLPVGVQGTINVYSRLQTTPRLHPVSIRLGEQMHFDETPDRKGEDRFTDRLMATLRSLVE